VLYRLQQKFNRSTTSVNNKVSISNKPRVSQGLINVQSLQARMEEARPEGPRHEAQRAESGGWGSWEGGQLPPPHQLRGMGEHCKPKSNLVYFSPKIWHLVATIRIIFMIIKWTNLMQFWL